MLTQKGNGLTTQMQKRIVRKTLSTVFSVVQVFLYFKYTFRKRVHCRWKNTIIMAKEFMCCLNKYNKRRKKNFFFLFCTIAGINKH